jgi:hypothetical protein
VLTALVGAQVIGEHRHPTLVERFTVLEGELTVKRAGSCWVPNGAGRRAACTCNNLLHTDMQSALKNRRSARKVRLRSAHGQVSPLIKCRVGAPFLAHPNRSCQFGSHLKFTDYEGSAHPSDFSSIILFFDLSVRGMEQ